MAWNIGRVSLAAAVAVGAFAIAPGGAGGQDPPECSQPYSPVAYASPYNGTEAELPVVDATALPSLRELVRATELDSDGDGTPDTVTAGTDAVTITRGDGVVVLTAGGAWISQTYGAGDLNGDGRDEIVVSPRDSPLYVVSGTIAPGTHDVATVGVIIAPATEPSGAFSAVNLGDGRLIVSSPTSEWLEGTTYLYETTTTVGSGGDTASPVDTFDGSPVFLVDLGASLETLVIVSGAAAATSATITLVDDGVTTLTTDPEPYLANDVGVGVVEVLSGADGTFVTLGRSGRGGNSSWMWSLDDPCTALVVDPPPTPTTPEAPAAQPVDAEAQLTG